MLLRVDRFVLSLPLTAIALSLASHAQAASFAGANVEAQLFDFNVAALDTNTFADTDAFSYAGDAGSVVNGNDASIDFLQDPAYLYNFAQGESAGEGSDYLGRTEGSTEALGQFWVEDVFSFQFDTFLDLAYVVDNPAHESAEAAGRLELSLYSSSDVDDPGSFSLVDQFSLNGNVSTGGDDFLDIVQSSTNFSIAVKDCPTGACELNIADEGYGLAMAEIKGGYLREFVEPTYLTLIETKFSGTIVKVPESNMAFALLLGGAALLWQRHSKATPLED